MEDFVKCLFCQKENVKQDEFLDLPLAVKQFGASDAFKSVVSIYTPKRSIFPYFYWFFIGRSSSRFYKARSTRRKQSVLLRRVQKKAKCIEGAILSHFFCFLLSSYLLVLCLHDCFVYSLFYSLQGLRIIKFPYLLSIQLKRFDFDCNTLHRIKLNDKYVRLFIFSCLILIIYREIYAGLLIGRLLKKLLKFSRMTFPSLLNLNEFVYDATKSEPPKKMSWASTVSVPRFSLLRFFSYLVSLAKSFWTFMFLLCVII